MTHQAVTYTHPVASNLPIKTLVARQLQANTNAHTCMHHALTLL